MCVCKQASQPLAFLVHGVCKTKELSHLVELQFSPGFVMDPHDKLSVDRLYGCIEGFLPSI